MDKVLSVVSVNGIDYALVGGETVAVMEIRDGILVPIEDNDTYGEVFAEFKAMYC